MKKIIHALKRKEACRVVARFGSAKVVNNSTGRFELCGGSKAERIEAREWASMFLHEAAI